MSRAVSAFLRKQLGRILKVRNWGRERERLAKVVEPILFGIAWTEAVEEHHRLMRTRQDPGLFERVVAWAKSYTYDLVKGITEITRGHLSEAIAKYVAEPQPMGTLREAIAPIFGPERANLIAVTEVTNAYSAGGSAAAEELREAGLEIIERWHTKNDGLVCDDCRSRNGRDCAEVGYPSAHPGCRCGVSREIA